MPGRLLETVEIETGPRPSASVIWLHGIDADGHTFEPLVGALAPPDLPIRMVMPHAPLRTVALCGGRRVRAWYDIRNQDRQVAQDEAAVRASAAAIQALICREGERGVPTHRVVVAGFSQGGAMALFTGTRFSQPLAGIIAVSCYRLLAQSFAVERQAANQNTPIFIAHGETDPVIPLSQADATHEQLRRCGYPLEWHVYPMGHELIAQETVAISAFLARALALTPIGR